MAIGVHGVHQYTTTTKGSSSLSPALSSLSSSSSSIQVSLKDRERALLEKEENKIDTLYGSDDLTDMNDILYKEDLFEDVRRATKMESFTSRRRSALFKECFEFLKIIFSFKS